MRVVSTELVKEKIKELFISANYTLPESLAGRIKESEKTESDSLAKSILSKLSDNLDAAKKIDVPICQDTGMAVVFAEIGQEVFMEGAPFEEAVNSGVAEAYTDGFMRKSVVGDPFFDRTNTQNNTPAIIHTRIVPGDKIKLTAAPKGFGSENMSAVRMFTPSATKQDIIDFVVDTVRRAGGNPCPPIVVGVGLGGTFEYCAYLAKKALSRDVDSPNSDERYAKLEKELLCEINKLNIGPQGFGGKTTALAVNIEKYATHIAGLPCAVNIGCHVTRHASAVI